MSTDMTRFLLAIAALVGCSATYRADAQPPVLSPLCREFQQLLGMSRDKGISRKALEDSLTRGAKEDADDHYFNLDIDGDDINDIVTRSCSHSTMPSDPCMLTINLSSGGKIDFEEWKFFLVRHRGKIYAVSAELGPNRKRGNGKIFTVGPRNVQEVCSGL
jgi:hypothetical protein